MWVIREYQHKDLHGCKAVFDSNADSFFAATEAEEFVDDLMCRERLPVSKRWPYFVLETAGVIRACGGYFVDGEGAAILLWGMVERHNHGKGLGKALLNYRIKYITQQCSVIKIDTTPQSFGFYQKAGFQQTGFVADGYERGMDKVYAELKLS